MNGFVYESDLNDVWLWWADEPLAASSQVFSFSLLLNKLWPDKLCRFLTASYFVLHVLSFDIKKKLSKTMYMYEFNTETAAFLFFMPVKRRCTRCMTSLLVEVSWVQYNTYLSVYMVLDKTETLVIQGCIKWKDTTLNSRVASRNLSPSIRFLEASV